MASHADRRELRVLSWPSLTTPNIQPYIAQLLEPMAAKGVQVEELSQGRVLWGRPRLVHAHWPDSLLHQTDVTIVRRSFRRLRLLLRVLRLRRIKLLWTAHNLRSHEGLHPELEAEFWDCWTRALDGFISLSESGIVAVRQRFPTLADKPAFLVPHGHYRDCYERPSLRSEARARRDVPADAQVLLFFGQVRAYKNLPQLIAAFRELDREAALLLVAGKPASPELEREIRAAAAEDPRVRLNLRFIEDDETADLFAAADLTALPFRDILNSGSALLSLSLNRRVLVPAKGAMTELASAVGSDWVTTYEGELSAGVLGQALDRALERRESERPDLSPFDWDPLVDRTIAAYRAVIAGTR